MSTLFLRVWISAHNFTVRKNELGQATSEYAVVAITAVALGLAVTALFTKGLLDDILHGLTEKALSFAQGMIK